MRNLSDIGTESDKLSISSLKWILWSRLTDRSEDRCRVHILQSDSTTASLIAAGAVHDSYDRPTFHR